MDSVVKARECQWCHKAYYLSDGRYKYCSDECAAAAQRARYGKTSRELVETSKKINGRIVFRPCDKLPDWFMCLLKGGKRRRKKSKKLSAR